MWKLKQWSALGLCLALGLTLGSCGKKEEPPEPPAAYEVGGDSAPSLNETVGDAGGTLSAITEPAADEPEDGAPAVPPVYTYTYSELEDSSQAVADYVAALTGEDEGFRMVDSQDMQTDAPAFDTETGNVSLAKNSAQEGKLLRLDIAWTADGCTVAVTQKEGAVQEQAEPEQAAEPKRLTAVDAVQYLESLPPSALELEGSSMKAYRVYYLDGEVLVNGAPCACLRVYSISPEGNNVFEGTYMLTGDQQHIYRMSSEGNTVREMELSQTSPANLKKG